jgi:hypothetical protein
MLLEEILKEDRLSMVEVELVLAIQSDMGKTVLSLYQETYFEDKLEGEALSNWATSLWVVVGFSLPVGFVIVRVAILAKMIEHIHSHIHMNLEQHSSQVLPVLLEVQSVSLTKSLVSIF